MDNNLNDNKVNESEDTASSKVSVSDVISSKIKSEAVHKNKKMRGWSHEAFDLIDSLMIAVIAIIVVFVFFIRVTYVSGTSMLPTLENADRLLVTDIFYTPEYNDIVILQANGLQNENGEYGKPIVKRVIGLPGDTISIDFQQGIVTRNGVELELDVDVNGKLYEDGHLINTLTTNAEDMNGPVTVPEGKIFVMGDNRNGSKDSRDKSVGLIDENYIVGKVVYRFLPLRSFGTVQ